MVIVDEKNTKTDIYRLLYKIISWVVVFTLGLVIGALYAQNRRLQAPSESIKECPKVEVTCRPSVYYYQTMINPFNPLLPATGAK